MDNNNFSRDIISQLEGLKNSAKSYFNNVKVNVSKVVSAYTPITPITTLLYRYYANFDNEQEILSLNNVYNASSISGQISLLSYDQ